MLFLGALFSQVQGNPGAPLGEHRAQISNYYNQPKLYTVLIRTTLCRHKFGFSLAILSLLYIQSNLLPKTQTQSRAAEDSFV